MLRQNMSVLLSLSVGRESDLRVKAFVGMQRAQSFFIQYHKAFMPKPNHYGALRRGVGVRHNLERVDFARTEMGAGVLFFGAVASGETALFLLGMTILLMAAQGNVGLASHHAEVADAGVLVLCLLAAAGSAGAVDAFKGFLSDRPSRTLTALRGCEQEVGLRDGLIFSVTNDPDAAGVPFVFATGGRPKINYGFASVKTLRNTIGLDVLKSTLVSLQQTPSRASGNGGVFLNTEGCARRRRRASGVIAKSNRFEV